MRLTIIILALLAPLGAAAGPDCSPKAVARARSAADKELGRNPQQARARLQAVKDGCWDSLDEPGQLWLLSDLSVAAHKAGDAAACVAFLEEADTDAAARHPKAARALLHNAGLCAEVVDGCDYKLDRDKVFCALELAVAYSERGAYDSYPEKACSLVPDAFGLDRGEGEPERCVELTESRRRGDEESYDQICPSLILVEVGGGRPPAPASPRPRRRRLRRRLLQPQARPQPAGRRRHHRRPR